MIKSLVLASVMLMVVACSETPVQPDESVVASVTVIPEPTLTAIPPIPTPEPPTATPSPVPTYTPQPTYTPAPTYTPEPTYTPHPTHTPEPTHTPIPTNTSLPPTVTTEPTQTPTWTPVPTATSTSTVLPTSTPVLRRLDRVSLWIAIVHFVPVEHKGQMEPGVYKYGKADEGAFKAFVDNHEFISTANMFVMEGGWYKLDGPDLDPNPTYPHKVTAWADRGPTYRNDYKCSRQRVADHATIYGCEH